MDSKWIKDLNVRPEAEIFQKKTQGKSFLTLFWAMIFFGYDSKNTGKESKNRQRDCIKLKSFWTPKEQLSKVKRKPTEWEKICLNYTLNKVLISKIYKELK